MKRILAIGILSFLMAPSVVAANDGFEGIWQLNGTNSYYGCHVNADNAIVCLFYAVDAIGDPFSTEAWLGSVSGDVATLNMSTILQKFDATWLLTSPNTLTMTLISCVTLVGDACSSPVGSTFNLTKIFD